MKKIFFFFFNSQLQKTNMHETLHTFLFDFLTGICEPMWTEGCRRRNEWLKPYCSPDTHCISRPGQVASRIILPTVREGYIFRSVCMFTVGGRLSSTREDGGLPPRGLGYGSRGWELPNRPPLLTSTGGHCSSQYASYWTAFFLKTNQ